ncbi:MAG: cobalamin-binding protein [Chitinophagaceae bacterium]|nr:MAG: cobalamin-binding protein [Chitinophagaceae bacterium]
MFLSAHRPPQSPQRIVSLVPSQTELLHFLGLEAETVGITKFCIHPRDWWRTKTRVGGTKNVHPDVVRNLEPDLIIANKEENVQEQVAALAKDFPVWVTDVNTVTEALQMIQDVGTITGKHKHALALKHRIEAEFATITSLHSSALGLKACYLIWKDPYMVAGSNSFINDMLRQAGFENAFGQHPRYPEVTLQDIQASGANVILLSSEPYPFNEKHVQDLQHHLGPVKILLADGEMFSWYGSRLLKSPAYFKQLMQQLQGIN